MFAELAIPNVTIQPSTDEVQSYLQKAVHTIVSISKSISQWNKDRQRVSLGKEHLTLKNFHKFNPIASQYK